MVTTTLQWSGKASGYRACYHETTALPHQQGGDLARLFLRVVACDELPEKPQPPDWLEQKGLEEIPA